MTLLFYKLKILRTNRTEQEHNATTEKEKNANLPENSCPNILFVKLAQQNKTANKTVKTEKYFLRFSSGKIQQLAKNKSNDSKIIQLAINAIAILFSKRMKLIKDAKLKTKKIFNLSL